MTSSTSHSETRVPALAVKLLVVAAVLWVMCVAYTLFLNPEVRFFSQLSAVQDAWSQKMDREHSHKVVVYGGSSCTFSINGEQMLRDYDLPTVNRGLVAGLGVKILTLHAIEDLKKGDTLLVALEPGLLTEPLETTSLAVQFSYAERHPNWAVRPALGLPGASRGSTLMDLRPGSYHALTLIGKLVSGRSLYRYDVADAHPSGWAVTSVRLPLLGPPGHGPYLSDDARRFLPALRDWCKERDIRVAYSLPWAYCPDDKLVTFRKSNANILLQISDFIPVLKEPQLGADTNADHFADTNFHLNEEGSRLRTDELGRTVKQRDVWTAEELRLLAAGQLDSPSASPLSD